MTDTCNNNLFTVWFLGVPSIYTLRKSFYIGVSQPDGYEESNHKGIFKNLIDLCNSLPLENTRPLNIACSYSFVVWFRSTKYVYNSILFHIQYFIILRSDLLALVSFTGTDIISHIGLFYVIPSGLETIVLLQE